LMALKLAPQTPPARREAPPVSKEAARSRRNAEVAKKPSGRPEAKRPPVRILVVVANIQAGSLKAEVEKGFVRTAFGHE
jgi:hypothetical protein